MAKCDLNGIAIEEINRNSGRAYAASITSGEIFRVTARHSKNGNVLLLVEGKALVCKGFDNNNFVADGCILYNPPMVKMLVAACDNSDASIFIVAGEVSKTAPAAETSDKVVSREELKKEMDELQSKYFSLKDEAKAAADARLAAIEKLLKTA